MTLTKGDDFPIHQTSEPIAFAGTDRNFYDRYFFNGYAYEGELFFAADGAPRISPHNRSTYASILELPNASEAKLQKLHFALQNGTER